MATKRSGPLPTGGAVHVRLNAAFFGSPSLCVTDAFGEQRPGRTKDGKRDDSNVPLSTTTNRPVQEAVPVNRIVRRPFGEYDDGSVSDHLLDIGRFEHMAAPAGTPMKFGAFMSHAVSPAPSRYPKDISKKKVLNRNNISSFFEQTKTETINWNQLCLRVRFTLIRKL
jgi:hypothetical protein